MRTSTTTVLIFVIAFALGACGKSDSKGGSGGAKKDDKAAGPKTVTLAKLGVKAEIPAEATVGKGVLGDGVMIQGPDLVVSIDDAKGKPKNPKAAKEDASMYSPQNAKVEKLADGFLLTFTNKGGMGTNYWLMGRRKIAGKAIWCSTTATRPAQLENAVKVCKSLKP